MLSDARSSFIWRTSLNLYNKRSFTKPLGDLDIVCIQDGKFIIGEVKNVSSLFSQSDFDKMETIARKIRPDKVIFSTLEEKPSITTKQMSNDLAIKLQRDGIMVEWLSFPGWTFEARPL